MTQEKSCAQPAHQAEPDHDAWKCDRCHGEGWHWVEREGVEWRDKVHSKEHCEQCDGLGFLGPDAAKAAEAELDKVLAEYRDASDHFDAEVLARFIKAYPKHAAALRRYSTVQLTFVQPTREEIEAEEVPAPDPALSAIDHLLMDLDMIARERDQYEYGLPIDCTATDGPMEDMRRKVRRFLERETAAIPAPEGALAELVKRLRGGGWDLRGPQEMADLIADQIERALTAPAPQDSLDSAQPSNQVAMQAAPVALTNEQIEAGYTAELSLRALPVGSPSEFTRGVRFAERTHGIPAPQTKEPTNDR